MQNSERMSIGLLVFQKEKDLDNLVNDILKQKMIKLIYVNKDEDSQGIIDKIAEGLGSDKGLVIRLGNNLDAKVYNQLDILSQAGHMEYPTTSERKFVYPVQGSFIVLIITDEDLENMNYTNILNFVALIERL